MQIKRSTIVLVLLLAVCVAAVVWALSSEIEQRSYPLEYVEQISNYAAQYEIDPYLVAAVIRTESSFNPDAVSKAGACGLMQLMPETGSWIAEKLKRPDYTEQTLFDPEINIEFGCWYLRFLYDRFDGDSTLIAAAYNAGHNRVKEWLLDESIAPSGTLTNIPFEETSQYVKRVSDAEEKYRALYPNAFAKGSQK